MDIDIILEPGTSAADAVRLGQLAERYGIRCVWASNFPGCRDPFLALTPLALESSRVRLGVLPFSPYEKQPLRLADTLLTFNELAGGRATLLVGGMGKSAMNAMGLLPHRRLTAVRECIDILRGASSGELVNYDGELYKALNYLPAWAADTAPQIYVGASGPKMLALAGRMADGVMLSDSTLHMLPDDLANIDRGLAASGRKRADIRINNFFAWHIKENAQAASDEARIELVWRGVLQRRYVESFLSESDTALVENNWHVFLNAFLQKTPVIENIPEHVVEALIENLTFTGGLDALPRVIDELKKFAAAGLDEIAFRMHREPEESIRIIGEELMPALSN